MTVPFGSDPPPIDDDMLSAYLDGDLSLPEQETVRRAIQTDAIVRERYREFAATVSLLRALPPPALPRSFTLTPDQVRGAHDGGPVPLTATTHRVSNVLTFAPPPRAARFTPLFGAFGAIAAVLLLVLITADFATGGFRAATPAAQQSSGAAVEGVTATTTSVAAAGAQSNPASGAARTTQPAPATSTVHPSDTTSASIPLALIRAVEVALAIVAIAGIVLAVQSARAHPRHMAHG